MLVMSTDELMSVALRRAAGPVSASALDRLEIVMGWAVVGYVFAVDQFVYQLTGRAVHAAVTAGFCALLYAYLLFLFYRSFAQRRRGKAADVSEAAIATK